MLRNDIKNNITIPNYIKLKYSQFWILIYQSIIDFLLYLWKRIDNVSYSNLTQKFKLYSWVCMYHSWKEKIHFWKTKTFIWCVSIAHCYHLVYKRPIATLFWWFERTYKKDRCITIEWWYVLRKSFEFIGIQGVNIYLYLNYNTMCVKLSDRYNWYNK